MREETKRRLGIAVELIARLCALLGLGYFALIAVGNAMRFHNAMSLLQLADQSLNVLFVVIARWPKAVNRWPHVVVLAVGTTFANLVIDYGHVNALVPIWVTYTLQVTGIAFQLIAKLSLGRSFGIVPANRGVKTGGAFRVVRHPTYLGYAIAQVGTMLGTASLRNVSVVLGLYGMLALRAWLEERVLRKDEAYRAYAERVRWRVIPYVW